MAPAAVQSALTVHWTQTLCRHTRSGAAQFAEARQSIHWWSGVVPPLVWQAKRLGFADVQK